MLHEKINLGNSGYGTRDTILTTYVQNNLEGVHAYNETVDVQDVVNAAKVYIGAITDYLGQE